MPKWTDYTTKTEPADNDEVMVLDTAGKANKRLSLSTLSDWVLGKIADKAFEKLQTNDKTILGAINELNSKSIFNGVKQSGTYSFPIKQNSCMLVVLQTSTSINAPVYVVSRYGTYICIQLLVGKRNDTTASVKNEQLVITLEYSSYVAIYSF